MESKVGGLDENPFSFKQFLKNQPEPSQPTVSVIHQTTTKNDHVGEDSKNVAKEIPFPDVHQQQDDLLLTRKKGKGKKTIKQSSNKKQELPDAQTDNPFSFKHFVKKDAALKTSGRVLQIIDDEVHEIGPSASDVEDPSISLPAQTASETAPDKDLQKLSTLQLITSPQEPEHPVLTSQQELYSEITKLKNENKTLRKELKEAKQLKENENKRVESLCKKLKEIEQKENEETVALEKMVHMVEKNLELTTQRAIKAEAMNVKLREENKILKSNSVSKAMYDELVNQHYTSLASIKDQATSAAQQLNITAKNAQESLKELYSGVDSFKLVSQLLSSIDKFSSFHEEPQS